MQQISRLLIIPMVMLGKLKKRLILTLSFFMLIVSALFLRATDEVPDMAEILRSADAAFSAGDLDMAESHVDTALKLQKYSVPARRLSERIKYARESPQASRNSYLLYFENIKASPSVREQIVRFSDAAYGSSHFPDSISPKAFSP